MARSKEFDAKTDDDADAFIDYAQERKTRRRDRRQKKSKKNRGSKKNQYNDFEDVDYEEFMGLR